MKEDEEGFEFWDINEYADIDFDTPTKLYFIESQNHLNENNPKLKDDEGNLIYEYQSISQIPNSCFKTPDRSILLPAISKKVTYATGISNRPILLKKSIIERNIDKHKEIKNNKQVLELAIYKPMIVMFNKPNTRPNYRVIAHQNDYVYWITIDDDNNKSFVEIVDWRVVGLLKFNNSTASAIAVGGWIRLAPFSY